MAAQQRTAAEEFLLLLLEPLHRSRGCSPKIVLRTGSPGVETPARQRFFTSTDDDKNYHYT